MKSRCKRKKHLRYSPRDNSGRKLALSAGGSGENTRPFVCRCKKGTCAECAETSSLPHKTTKSAGKGGKHELKVPPQPKLDPVNSRHTSPESGKVEEDDLNGSAIKRAFENDLSSPPSFSGEPGMMTLEKIMALRDEFAANEKKAGDIWDQAVQMLANDYQIFDMVAPPWAKLLAKLKIIDRSEYVEAGGMIVAHYFRFILAVSLALPVVGLIVIALISFFQK